MRFHDQGSDRAESYSAVPRVLVFLTHGDDILLLRGAPGKRIWPDRLNGVGGHVEPGEDVRAAAVREAKEETGLDVSDLDLRAIVHISGSPGSMGVMNFVFLGGAPTTHVACSREGDLVWLPRRQLPCSELVDDLRLLLPLVLDPERTATVYGSYVPDSTGEMHFLLS